MFLFVGTNIWNWKAYSLSKALPYAYNPENRSNPYFPTPAHLHLLWTLVLFTETALGQSVRCTKVSLLFGERNCFSNMWLFSKVSLHIATWHGYQTRNFGLCFALSGTISGQRATLCHIDRNLRDSEKKRDILVLNCVSSFCPSLEEYFHFTAFAAHLWWTIHSCVTKNKMEKATCLC